MKINVIDVESTCWENDKTKISEIIQIGICTYDTVTGKISPAESIYVTPTQSTELSPFCTKLTGLTDEQVFGQGVSFSEAANILSTEYKSSNTPWVSWGDYDRRMFQDDSKRSGIRNPLCPQHLNAKVFFSIMTGEKLMGMEKALTYLKLDLLGRHHDGADDAYNIARILAFFTPKGWAHPSH
jgi:inhibitor of KinA sporulation pathway (predicted exonuclease)